MVTFQEQAKEVDAVCKQVRATGSGSINAKHLMMAIENLFKTKGWNFPAYIAWANENHNARVAAEEAARRASKKDTSPEMEAVLKELEKHK